MTTRALFVCSRGRIRSVTAARVASGWEGVETDYAGVLKDADVRLSADQLEWADVVFVMEKAHKKRLDREFRPLLRGKRVVCLDVRDIYEPMQPALVRVLEEKLTRVLREG